MRYAESAVCRKSLMGCSHTPGHTAENCGRCGLERTQPGAPAATRRLVRRGITAAAKAGEKRTVPGHRARWLFFDVIRCGKCLRPRRERERAQALGRSSAAGMRGARRRRLADARNASPRGKAFAFNRAAGRRTTLQVALRRQEWSSRSPPRRYRLQLQGHP